MFIHEKDEIVKCCTTTVNVTELDLRGSKFSDRPFSLEGSPVVFAILLKKPNGHADVLFRMRNILQNKATSTAL